MCTLKLDHCRKNLAYRKHATEWTAEAYFSDDEVWAQIWWEHNLLANIYHHFSHDSIYFFLHLMHLQICRRSLRGEWEVLHIIEFLTPTENFAIWFRAKWAKRAHTTKGGIKNLRHTNRENEQFCDSVKNKKLR